jgi:hypothetical protein
VGSKQAHAAYAQHRVAEQTAVVQCAVIRQGSVFFVKIDFNCSSRTFLWNSQAARWSDACWVARTASIVEQLHFVRRLSEVEDDIAGIADRLPQRPAAVRDGA